MEDDEVEHRGHPHPHADVGAVVEQVEAEVHEEDLHRDHDAVEHTRQDAGFEVLLESLAVGGPPVTGLIAQSAQDGVVHARQHRPGQDAAHGGAEHHDGQAVHQKADVHQTDDGQKAQTGEQVCKEHPAHIPAHQLEEAAYAGLAGGVLFDARPGLEIVCRREQTHVVWISSLAVPKDGLHCTARFWQEAPLCWLSDYKYTRILWILQAAKPSKCKKSISSPFLGRSVIQ